MFRQASTELPQHLLSHALASSGAGKRALIVFGIIGGLVVVSVIGAFLQDVDFSGFVDLFEGIIGLLLPIIIAAGVIAAIVGFIVGIPGLIIGGIVWAIIAGVLLGLSG
jgi:hypothetical protein